MSTPTNHTLDDHVDAEIASYIDLDSPKSFFLFAGAGSGKTRSLVHALHHIQKKYGAQLALRGQRVAVITYTNAACDEINRRIDFDPVILVRTIHSFAWMVIDGYTRDIREWLRISLREDIQELQALEAKGRKGTKASATRLSQIRSKNTRLEKLDEVKRFTYSPTGDNRGRDSLNHSEVIKLVSYFIENKPVMRSILAKGFPIVLVDESQDTNKHLVDALFSLQSSHPEDFILGLLGDTMQRIYSDGKEGLGTQLPADWATPVKRLNHRCPKRIVTLINKVREATDRQSQEARSDSIDGHVRLFILPADTRDKPAAESAVTKYMKELTGDADWEAPDGCKRLILEHRMAASRLGFLDMFAALYDVDDFRTGLLDGTLSALRLFSKTVLPLVQRRDDKFALAKIVRGASPLIAADKLRAASEQANLMKQANDAVKSLLQLWDNGGSPSFGDVLRNVSASGLFAIPDSLSSSSYASDVTSVTPDEDESETASERAEAIEAFLATPFSQIESYDSYVSGTASFDTHQGVKGLEFPRVMVIMDDTEARGFLFKYDKLFSTASGEDTSLASTRRLFYVTCSRAERGLALVAYSKNPESVRQHVLREGWFSEAELQVGSVTA